MERLIANLLELSRLADHTTLTLSQFDLQTTVAELVMLMEGITFKRDITFDVQIDEAARYVLADAHDMTQVLQNLIGNAVKYNRDGGQVFITAQAAQPGEVRVTIRDTGIGIPPEKQRTIFEAFAQADTSTTRKYGGTGLGLAISSRLVELMGGKIDI
ncbi:MAG: hypothetical protein H7Y11_11660, partial [Armatimonadetes bacterium]|nr:hypothetical protein [Anaerolineae bacterium]